MSDTFDAQAVSDWPTYKATPNGPDGKYWYGTYKPTFWDPAPPPGVNVAYLLCSVLPDDRWEPRYAGSTDSFRARLGQHRHYGREFDTWIAFPGRSRYHAHLLEIALIDEYEPCENVIRYWDIRSSGLIEGLLA